MPVYELTLPINYEYENFLDLAFYPNKSVHITFLTFEHLWNSFIETLKFESFYEDRRQSIEKYETLRSEYIRIFTKISIDSIFIVTDAYYKIEDLVNEGTYPTLTFSDIPKMAKELDNLTSFDLEKIFRADKVSEICTDFLTEPSLNRNSALI